jgi:hypothetical protein
MSKWEENQIADKILGILDVESIPAGHHLGRPFMTPYQIAIAFKQEYPKTFNDIGLPLGGKGTSQHTSFAQYIGRELSRRIKDGPLSEKIEGGFFFHGFLKELTFLDGVMEIKSSSEKSYHVSIFRLKD